MSDRRDDEHEPKDATEDRLGQRIDRDTELAEELADRHDDPGEAERRFEQAKEGPRPEDVPTEDRP